VALDVVEVCEHLLGPSVDLDGLLIGAMPHQVDDSSSASSSTGINWVGHCVEEEICLTIGDTAPDFTAETTEGPISLRPDRRLAVMFSHPRDSLPFAPPSLGYMAKIKPEFDRRNVKVTGRRSIP
jgi:hypothetical protein